MSARTIPTTPGCTLVKCPHCSGLGTVPLLAPLQQTLDYVRAHPDCSVPDLYQVFTDVKDQSAISNRLRALTTLGLVSRTRVPMETRNPKHRHNGIKYTYTATA